MPFAFTPQLHVDYFGTFWQLLSPFALLCGLLSLSLVIMQGGVWLQLKTEGVIRQRALSATRYSALLIVICFLLAGYWLWAGVDGFVLLTQDANGPSNPLLKGVAILHGAWMNHFIRSPLLLIIPLLGMILPILAFYACLRGQTIRGFLFASLTRACVIFTAGITLFPFVMPSSVSPLQPDGVGQHLQPDDARNHAGDCADFSADRTALYAMELLQNVGAYQHGDPPPQRS